jgi:hypothetical protein
MFKLWTIVRDDDLFKYVTIFQLFPTCGVLSELILYARACSAFDQFWNHWKQIDVTAASEVLFQISILEIEWLLQPSNLPIHGILVDV